MHGSLLFADESFRIRGVAFEVYRVLGTGFLESVYQECMGIEFSERGIPFAPMPQLTLSYKGRELRQRYMPDFVCFDQIVVELRAARDVAPEHRAQTINYLKGTGLRLGLLINFGSSSGVQIERFAL